MKRLVSLFSVCLLMMSLLCCLPVRAAAGLTVTASATTVTVGQNVTVTLKYNGDGNPIGGVIGSLTYDTEQFTYTSFTGSDVEVNGGAGKMRFTFDASGAQAPTSVTVTFTFKANAPGKCTFAAATEEFFNDNDYSSLGAPTDSVTVTANNPTLSGNANLKSLVPSKGTLTPKFAPNKTEYTIAVAHSVTSLSLSATTEHNDAKTSISGKNALEVGKNTRVITVTAPNGDTKKYTVVITRAAAPSTTTGTNPTTTGTTTPPPPDDALDVSVDGKRLTILDTQAAVDLPRGFTWSNLTINRVEVPAAVNSETGMTLLYLVSEDKTDDGFYIYHAEEDSFIRYRALTIQGRDYLLYNLPAGKTLGGMVQGTLAYDGGEISAFLYEDEALSDYYVVWAAPVGGETGWYTYDKQEGTLQRYHVATVAPTQPDAPTVDVDGDADTAPHKAGSFLEEYRQILLIGGVVLAGIVVIVLLVVLFAGGSRKKGKH